MRISDWSSDVCSSDLIGVAKALAERRKVERRHIAGATGRAFDDMDVSDAQRVELINDMVEQGLFVFRDNGSARWRYGRQAHNRPVGADFFRHRLGHLDPQASQVLNLSTQAVSAPLSAIAQARRKQKVLEDP